MQRPWKWPASGLSADLDRWVSRYGMPRAVAHILVHRGFIDETALDRFLHPRLGRLGDPSTLGGMARAVARVWRAVDRKETIFVHGDYDVDGITGTAFLARTLGAVGAEVVPWVPNRSEGYGLGDPGIRAAVRAGAVVLITVDNGIRSIDEIAAANAAGLDVIVLDHHPPGDRLPDALALVNPRNEAGVNGFEDLAAVGVAAKFVHAVAAARPGTLPQEAYKEALQLVALGTIADVVPLTGENRILVSYGLRRLAGSRWTGVQALKAVAGLDRPRLSSTDVAFSLAPRINAAGRMGEARDALALLMADDPVEAYRLAARIENMNRDRQKVERGMAEEAADQVRLRGELPPALVLWSDDWAVGVVGIVASRMLDRYARPSFLIAMEGETGRGSARSRPEFPLPAALAACHDLLETYGGHAEAAGFTIRRENLDPFRGRIEEAARDASLDGEPEPLLVDAEVGLEELTAPFVGWMHRLGPFGRGNPEPLLGCRGLEVAEAPSVVGERHLRLSVAAGGRRMRAVAFHQGDRAESLGVGSKVDAVFHAEFDTWRGGTAVQMVIRDLKSR